MYSHWEIFREDGNHVCADHVVHYMVGLEAPSTHPATPGGPAKEGLKRASGDGKSLLKYFLIGMDCLCYWPAVSIGWLLGDNR